MGSHSNNIGRNAASECIWRRGREIPHFKLHVGQVDRISISDTELCIKLCIKHVNQLSIDCIELVNESLPFSDTKLGNQLFVVCIELVNESLPFSDTELGNQLSIVCS
jgi:hypothetical protein